MEGSESSQLPHQRGKIAARFEKKNLFKTFLPGMGGKNKRGRGHKTEPAHYTPNE